MARSSEAPKIDRATLERVRDGLQELGSDEIVFSPSQQQIDQQREEAEKLNYNGGYRKSIFHNMLQQKEDISPE